MSKSNNNDRQQRQFDWGPPTNQTTESMKEWFFYVLILAVLAAGVWILLDVSNGERSSAKATFETELTEEIPEEIVSAKKETQKIKISEGKFLVQMGAFAEELDARQIFDKLVIAGYKPKLVEPDDQYEIYRVFVGPYKTNTEAEKVVEKLTEADFICFVIEAYD